MTDEKQAVAIARDNYVLCGNGDIQIDDDAATSAADDGIWVAAWVWVSNSELERVMP